MSATPQDVQAKLDAAVSALELTTVGYKNKYWKTPPAGSQWAVGLAAIAAARAEAGQLVAPSPPPPTPPPSPGGNLRILVDYSTGDLSQWPNVADAWIVDSGGFGWGPTTYTTEQHDEQAGCAKFYCPPQQPGQTGATAAICRYMNQFPAQPVEEWIGFSFLFPSGDETPTSFYGTCIAQFFKADGDTGDPMWQADNASEPVQLQYAGQNTNGQEAVYITIQSGGWPAAASQWYSGPADEIRYVGSNPFPQGGMKAVPTSLFAYDTWLHIILHVRWSPNTDGGVEAWAKRKGASAWTHTVPWTTGFPTLDYWAPTGPSSAYGYAKHHQVGDYTSMFHNQGHRVYNAFYCHGTDFATVAAALG